MLTQAHSLELFAEALKAFVDNGTDKTVVEARRYKKSTLGLALAFAAMLSANVVMLVFGRIDLDKRESVPERPAPVEVPAVVVPILPAADPTLIVLQRQMVASVQLQLEQSSYLTEVLVAVSSRKRVPAKPPSLLAAEVALLKATSPPP